MLKISAQIGDDFLGTAEELAHHVSKKLEELGFGDRHHATERLVRFYTYENLISKPERANDDRRKANYGSLQCANCCWLGCWPNAAGNSTASAICSRITPRSIN